MQIARLLLILGVWVAILPYLGFPLTIKNLLFVLTGLVFVYLSLLMYKDHSKKNHSKTKNNDSFSENFYFNK